MNLPKEIEDSYRQAIDRMNTAGHLAGRDKDFKYVANLDLDVSEARRKARDFQNDHDKLEMDLDLKSAAASAHLMYLTRPRSVEIYARLHATDMGKLIDGMLYGATGLRGVNNQFQRLVNLFDTLDTKVPILGAVGAVIGGVSAGAVNLSSSVLGVAASLGAMSKAAFALPPPSPAWVRRSSCSNMRGAKKAPRSATRSTSPRRSSPVSATPWTRRSTRRRVQPSEA
ncbi:hypothetical protein BLI007_07070 [Bifidobacterium longum subsp. infantis]|uniref:hypothetical protein n=1 Tax=Bifidobacterium longum TaxID=216816 RepID=UPI001C7DA012|nr:hypothetical protein [Bifidobacterium longum]MBX4249599.1 hypothetical protein [Bifidobacterium longum subsp. infantis]